MERRAAEAASPDPLPEVVGLILAGGRARRMGGGDKCLLQMGDRSLLEAVMRRAAPQVTRLLLSANGDSRRFAAYGIPVIADSVGDDAGPLAGVLAGLEWTQSHRPACAWVASFAADTPFLPTDFVARLLHAVQGSAAELVCASSRGRAHPVFALWPVRLAAPLRCALQEENLRKIDTWTSRYRTAYIDFEDRAGVDPFFNVNALEDLARASELLSLIDAEGSFGGPTSGTAP